MSSEASPPPMGAGQVCDRCRAKKVKCDGAVPQCGHCASASVPCIVSAKLKRKTKIRGFQASSEEELVRLRAENSELKTTLQAERDVIASLQRRLEELSQPSQALTEPLLFRSNPNTPSTEKSGPVVQHMGRLVLDDEGFERFAGSTTGVHFLLSVQQSLHQKGIIHDRFPESCYRLHLLSPVRDSWLQPTSWLSSRQNGPEFLSQLKAVFDRPISFYVRQISLFQKTWFSLCPLVAESDLIRHVIEAQDALRRGTLLRTFGYCFQMLAIMLINSSTAQDNTERIDATACSKLVRIMSSHLASMADLTSLQGLALFAFYIQISGKALLMPQLNGILVRIAQLLGLHRHHRRFRFSAGQIEMRNRLWWFIFIYDKITSITLGLPQLIQDMDVDTDLPTDCELEEVETSHISFPLPGETTKMAGFLAAISLCRILAEVLELLYTTTHRRQGVEKITKLHQDLLNWRNRFNPHQSEEGSVGNDMPKEEASQTWLNAMDHYAMLLIHRPGLTFDESTPFFKENLIHCTLACSGIIGLLCPPNCESRVRGIPPLGYSLLLHCGLTHIYFQSYQFEHQTNSSLPSGESSLNAVKCVIDSLSYCKLTEHGNQEASQPFTIAISDAIQVLGNLSQATLNHLDNASGSIGSSLLDPPLASSLASGNAWFDIASLEVGHGVGGLETLNQLDLIDWMSENPFSALSGTE